MSQIVTCVAQITLGDRLNIFVALRYGLFNIGQFEDL